MCSQIQDGKQLNLSMESENSQSSGQLSSQKVNPAMTSCRKKKKDDATFLEDVREHIDEFIHASMDEHKSCFQKTIKKVSRVELKWKRNLHILHSFTFSSFL